MDADIPSIVDTKPVTVKVADEGMTPSVTDTDVETAGNMERPTVGQGVDDTLDADIQEVIPEDAGKKRKSMKRKHKKSTDVGESSKPKKKLSKEERKSKREMKAERRAKTAAEEAADADDDVPEGAKESVLEDVMPSVTQPTADDEWLPEHEPQGDNAKETQESNEEDIAVVITKKRKTTSKLKLNENRTRVENRRIPKNIASVSTANVSLNSEEEEARWRFVANHSIAVEKMLSEATKKNRNIMGILEGAGVMPTTATGGPYYSKLVREFIYNITEDINDHASANYHKETFRNFTFDFSPRIINEYFARANGVLRDITCNYLLLSKC
ncbi:hypothetical protein LIER_36269 [Lithospermum erythrorhizon]|uniref:Uncharacterized protein n=1 Tax=Lithospermum erythrorhizon TaxID=34254 RepID=A0AAV3P816_LITER